MKSKKNKFLSILISITLILTIIPSMTITSFADDFTGTQREYIVYLIKDAGMKDNMLGTNADRDALAKSLGFLDNWDYNPTAAVTPQVQAAMDAAMAGAYSGLKTALNKKPMAPYFVNGMAQPIFYYGNNIYNDTSGEGAVRYIVYVETDLDTDNDGKLDLVKTLVQLPRAALDGAKFSTIFEARPYIEGTGSQTIPSGAQTAGNTFLSANPTYGHANLYATAAPRATAGQTTTLAMVTGANFREWYYRFTYNSAGNGSATIANGTLTNETEYEDLNWYDYFLVRGFAVVQSAGIGSAGSEGYATCGADVEVNGLRCVIEWLTGDRKAYSNKTGNIEVKADWSNGNVGMTGRSYAGTTQFGIATSGVKGLKTIVPVAGIASWYEYTNGQGVPISIPYVTGLAWYVNSRLAAPDWSTVFNRYAGYSQIMRNEENALNGDYGPHWARRDYTVENWFRDWGPSKIKCPILIVHGANDDNVRPKQSVMMYEAAKKAGVEVRWLWHQGNHMTPTFPRATPNATDTYRPYTMYCGDYTYDEWLNMWFSHHLYGLDNNIMKIMPGVLALDNDSKQWMKYDSWDCPSKIIFDNKDRVGASAFSAAMADVSRYEEPEDFSEEFPIPGDLNTGIVQRNEAVESGPIMAPAAAADEVSTTLINSANGSSSWQNFLNAPTAGSTLYSLELPRDVTVKGVVKIKMRAAITSASPTDLLRVHAKIVEVAAPGKTLKYYGSNAMGSMTVSRVTNGNGWQGGGLTSFGLCEFVQSTTGTYREIAKGWMDLCNPGTNFDSNTANRTNRIVPSANLGVYHDYTLCLQPAVHTAKAGNRLVVIITTGGSSTAAYSGTSGFTFTIDNLNTYADIPIESKQLSVDSRLSIRSADTFRAVASNAPQFRLIASEAVDVNLIVASYDSEGRLVDIGMTSKALAADETAVVQASVPNKPGLTYKFYMWDKKMVPLTGINSTDDL